MIARAFPYHEAQIISISERIKKSKREESDTLKVSLSNRIIFIKTSDIIFCKSESNYTHIFLANGDRVLSSKCLKYYQEKICMRNFIRCHASYLVNIDSIESLAFGINTMYVGPHKIPISRSRKKNVKTIFNSK